MTDPRSKAGRDVLAIMDAAIEFFQHHPERWLKGGFATDDRGEWIDPRDPDAHCFCALGIVSNRAYALVPGAYARQRATLIAKKSYHFRTMSIINDRSTTVFTVIEMMKIARAEMEPFA